MRRYRGIVKGVDTPKKRWAYGWYCEVEGKHYIILDDAELVPKGIRAEYRIIEGFIEVDPKTVGQLIGIKDNRRKDCYFGDFIKDDNGHIGEIKWDDKKLRVYFDWDDKQKSYPLEHYDYIDFEIIGNIHENPKLLEPK